MKSSTFLKAGVLSLAALSFSSSASIVSLHSVLGGAQEVPANASPATGVADLSYDDVSNILTWDIDFAGLVAGLTNSHFHGNAPPGVAAGVKIAIPHTNGVTFGNLAGSAAVAQADEAALLGGLWYINIHSQSFPGGEIRGQVLAVPEPSTILLLAIGCAGFLAQRRLRQA